MTPTRTVLLATGLSLTFGMTPLGTGQAAGLVQRRLTLREHHFIPRELHVPAGVEVAITISNTDISAEEFESLGLDVRRPLPAGQETVVRVLPQRPGRYIFHGAYNEDRAIGVLVVDPAN